MGTTDIPCPPISEGQLEVTLASDYKNSGIHATKYWKSAKWLAKREAVLRRDDYTCQMCEKSIDDDNVSRLHVHHMTYKNLYNEPLDDLITLCTQCHRRLHKIRPLIRVTERDGKKYNVAEPPRCYFADKPRLKQRIKDYNDATY